MHDRAPTDNGESFMMRDKVISQSISTKVEWEKHEVVVRLLNFGCSLLSFDWNCTFSLIEEYVYFF
jgi:hypothetical protein